VRLALAQLESCCDAKSSGSLWGIPFKLFFWICGNYDSVVYGGAL